jgi:hypothetical protein
VRVFLHGDLREMVLWAALAVRCSNEDEKDYAKISIVID